MSVELQLLTWSILLGVVQVFLTASAATGQRGVKWNMSSRDQSKPPLTGVAGRLSRAFENFKETFPFFLGAVIIAQVLGKTTGASMLGAHLYFWGRVLYIPIYAFDLIGIRTVVWAVSVVGILMVLSVAF